MWFPKIPKYTEAHMERSLKREQSAADHRMYRTHRYILVIVFNCMTR